MKCGNCIFYLKELDNCMFCTFISADDEYDNFQKPFSFKQNIAICKHQEKEEFDILKLNDESDFCDQWSHKKILSRLHNNGIDCFFVDMWGCDEVAFITGIKSDEEEVARVLGLHKECVYYDYEHDFMILNLFQEKVLRENDT